MVIRALNLQHKALLEAAAAGDLEVLQESDSDLLRASCCVSGCSLLHWAAGANQVEVVCYLVKTVGMDVNIPVAANKKAAGRTPLHYAARNGCLEAVICLVEDLGADCNVAAKHGVTPFQLTLFQNQLRAAAWLVDVCHVNLFQSNEFGCNALHWLAICPASRAGKDGINLLPTADWLYDIQTQQQSNSDAAIDLFTATQKQGHNALHKAAWMGHTQLVRYLHERYDIWDDVADYAGNYAAVLAEMGGHFATADFLRQHCSRSAEHSCDILGIGVLDASNPVTIRQAYLQKAKELHPDRRHGTDTTDAFDAIRKAYQHLTVHQGRGQQRNPTHSLKLMLQVSGVGDTKGTVTLDEGNLHGGGDDDCFKARLIAVLLEYGDKG